MFKSKTTQMAKVIRMALKNKAKIFNQMWSQIFLTDFLSNFWMCCHDYKWPGYRREWQRGWFDACMVSMVTVLFIDRAHA